MTNLELKCFLKIDLFFSVSNFHKIWGKANRLLQTEEFKPRQLIQNANVKAVCTTDNPDSDLYYRKLLSQKELENGFKVFPAVCPDNLLNISADNDGKYLNKLEKLSDIEICGFDDLVLAIDSCFHYFDSLGGRLSKLGLNNSHFVKLDKKQLDLIIQKVKKNNYVLNSEKYMAIKLS